MFCGWYKVNITCRICLIDKLYMYIFCIDWLKLFNLCLSDRLVYLNISLSVITHWCICKNSKSFLWHSHIAFLAFCPAFFIVIAFQLFRHGCINKHFLRSIDNAKVDKDLKHWFKKNCFKYICKYLKCFSCCLWNTSIPLFFEFLFVNLGISGTLYIKIRCFLTLHSTICFWV